MTDYVWKHLPYAISELVLSEWCEFITEVLENNRRKLLSSISLLNRYGISVPDVKLGQIGLPEKAQLVGLVSEMIKTAGFTVIPNWETPLSRLLNEAMAKRPPFDKGGKGLCDAVILETFAEHAKENFTQARVLVISNDGAVKRSGARFSDRGIGVDFVGDNDIVAKLKSLLANEVSAYIETKKSKLKEYILAHEYEILDYVRKTQLEITDWKLNPPFGEQLDGIFGTIESILSVRPLRVTDVIGGAPTYGEKIVEGRYAVRISVEIELEIVIREPGFGINALEPQARVVVQFDMLDGKSPLSLEEKNYDWKYREILKTITRDFTVFATLDGEKKKEGVFDDLRIEKVS